MSKIFQLDRQEYSKGQENVFSFEKERKYKLFLKFFHNMSIVKVFVFEID